jgi:hypothetical protein
MVQSKNKGNSNRKGGQVFSNSSDSSRKDYYKAIKDARMNGRMDVILVNIAIIIVVGLIWKNRQK